MTFLSVAADLRKALALGISEKHSQNPYISIIRRNPVYWRKLASLVDDADHVGTVTQRASSMIQDGLRQFVSGFTSVPPGSPSGNNVCEWFLHVLTNCKIAMFFTRETQNRLYNDDSMCVFLLLKNVNELARQAFFLNRYWFFTKKSVF